MLPRSEFAVFVSELSAACDSYRRTKLEERTAGMAKSVVWMLGIPTALTGLIIGTVACSAGEKFGEQERRR
jgi:hypothetical protein